MISLVPLKKYLIIISLVSVFTIFIHSQYGFPQIGIDDANIFFVYAKNLANGHGFIYSNGERVEGFTSILWVLICTLFFLTTQNPERILFIFNIIIVSIGITVIVDYIDSLVISNFKNKISRDEISVQSFFFLSIIFSLPTFLPWTTFSLMETGLWSLLLILSTITSLKLIEKNDKKYNIQLAVLLSLLVLTRPEAMLFGGVFIVINFLCITIKSNFRTAFFSTISPASIFVITIAAITCFRIIYFSYPLPNTYYAKVSPSIVYNIMQGSKYLYQYFLSSIIIQFAIILTALGLFVTMILFVNFFFFSGKSSIENLILNICILSSLMVTGLMIPVLTGGDHFDLFRLYQPIIPLLIFNILLIYIYIKKKFNITIFNRLSRNYKYIITFLIFLLLSYNENLFDQKKTSNLKNEFLIAAQGRKLGAYMNDLFSVSSAYPSIGVITSGGVGYSYSGPVLDLMGLNNIKMAHYNGNRKGIKNHAAFNKKVFYDLKPDIVIPAVSRYPYDHNKIKKTFLNVVLKGLLEDKLFNELYLNSVVERKDLKGKKKLVGFFRKDYLTELAKNNKYQVLIVQID